MDIKDSFLHLKQAVNAEKKLAKELESSLEHLKNSKSTSERKMISSHVITLEKTLEKANNGVLNILEGISLVKPLNYKPNVKIPEAKENINQVNYNPQIASVPAPVVSNQNLKGANTKKLQKELKFEELEKQTIKNMKKKKKKKVIKLAKAPGAYVRLASKVFSKRAEELSEKKMFKILGKNLIKHNSPLILASYISLILFTTIIAIFVGIFLFLFLLIFNVGLAFPFITLLEENILLRLVKVSWILLVVPLGTFFFMYRYPALERKSAESKINQELPFATIHMAAISGSMINPTDIFSIIISTKEYPYIQKEFTKLLNEVNVYGYNLVKALKNSAKNSPSLKLSELLSGLATTINTGGELPEFFDKRSQTLLFDYRLEREKYTKSAETFMDIYISVVIAAPMILMLLMMMMKIGGVGVTLSTQMITLIIVLGVTIINIVFLTFLHLKQPNN